MTATAELHGTLHQVDKPNWTPLESLLDQALVRRFVWMWELELQDGTRVHAYKDRATNVYLHLTEDGRAFHFRGESSYREVAPETALIAALARTSPDERLSEVEDLALRLALAKLRESRGREEPDG